MVSAHHLIERRGDVGVCTTCVTTCAHNPRHTYTTVSAGNRFSSHSKFPNCMRSSSTWWIELTQMMENPPHALRLHQIHSSMPFGCTNYVPEEETRNLCASFPEADILQPFKEIATNANPRRESFEITAKVPISRSETLDYCKDLSLRSLSHPDYRKLSWTYLQGDYEDSLDYSRRTRVTKATSPNSLYVGEKRTSVPSEILISKLESRYRTGNAIPFCLNPQAAYLIHHSSITGQRKRVEQELGTCVVYLNDRAHFKTLERRLQARLERKSDEDHHNRSCIERKKTRGALRGEWGDFSPTLQKGELGPDPLEGSPPKFRFSKRSNLQDKSKDYSPDFASADVSRSISTKENLNEASEPLLTRTVTEDSAVQNSKRSAGLSSSPLKSGSAEGLLSSRLSMRTLYDTAEKSVRSQQPPRNLTLKYTNLSWERM
ncbi:unnamed protein product [Dicrocoelium dendriticum]|nr:unnamed protein product [Dicrocoelium dendriticum]